MQKLVTIALSGGSPNYIMHGEAEEHLEDLLRSGWKVLSVTPVGAAAGGGDSSLCHFGGWLAVVLQKL
jgi:hypothetical protein